jgi:hypothetical protein
MAVNFGTDNQGGSARRFSMATPPALPSGQDWCVGFWARFADLSGSNFEYVISRGTLGGNGSLHIFFGQESSSNPSQLNMRAKGTGGTENNFGSATVADNGTDFLCVVQRRGSNIETYVVAKGASVSAPNTSNTDASTGDIATGTTLIGGRTDLLNARFYRNTLGEVFWLVNDSLTAAEVENLAIGKNIVEERADPEVNLRFLTYSTTENDLSDNNHDATVTGSGIVTADHFFTDGEQAALATSGATASTFAADADALVAAANTATTASAQTTVAAAVDTVDTTSTAVAALTAAAAAPAAVSDSSASTSTQVAAAQAADAFVADSAAATVFGVVVNSLSSLDAAAVSATEFLPKAQIAIQIAESVTAATFGSAGNAPVVLDTTSASGSVLAALAQASAALVAAQSTGEAWSAQVAALVDLLTTDATAAMFSAAADDVDVGLLAASSTTAADFLSAAEAIAASTNNASTSAGIIAIAVALVSIAETGTISATFAGADIVPAALAAALSTTGAFTALATLTAALQVTSGTDTVFGQSGAVQVAFTASAQATASFYPFTGAANRLILAAIATRAALAITARSRTALSLTIEDR